MKRRLKFRLHFNRINMQRGNPNVWTVHTSRGYFQGVHIDCIVPIWTVFKKNGSQPRAYLQGYGHVRVTKEGIIQVF